MPRSLHQETIRFYSVHDPYGEFSNFALFPITLKRKRWPTSEHYFQAQKFADAGDQEEIRRAKTPMIAARLGRERSRVLRRDWEAVKVAVMREAVEAKFRQNPELGALLMATGDALLVEHTENDSYWGDGGDGTGRNMLGRILMEVREALRPPWQGRATSEALDALFEKLDSGSGGIRLYGIAPPKLATEPERLREIADQQLERIRVLAPDGLVVYDIQDEPGRAGQVRPFPFLPTVDPDAYAYDSLSELAIPKIVYRCVGAHPREAFSRWVDTLRAEGSRRLGVLVGAPRGRSQSPGLPLTEAYELARAAPNLVLGGIAIAERHVAKEDEHQRMLAKQDQGCRFFITQAVYDSASTRSLLSDYALALQESGRSPAPIVLTFSPCGSVRTLDFMKWLGISFPRWLENELRHSPDTLERSIELCERVFDDVQDYAREKRLPLGINVESVSIRKSEIDASMELFRRLSSRCAG